MKPIRLLILGLVILAMPFFTSFAQALEEGETAPTFTAASTQGEISLAQYAGEKHVVLALYFAVFTPV